MSSRRRISPQTSVLNVIALLAMALATSGCSTRLGYQMSRLLFGGESRTLRERPDGTAPNSPRRPALLILALDGIDRPVLYDMLRAGSLPALATLLRAEGTRFPHAYFDDSRIATLPSSTITAWVTAFTGVAPAYHGVTGNEFFVRNSRELMVPITGAVSDPAPGMACYTEDYLVCLRGGSFDMRRPE